MVAIEVPIFKPGLVTNGIKQSFTELRNTIAMTPRKSKHQAQYSNISEYESDVNQFAEIPRPPERTDAELNISVLQRYNPHVTSVEYIAPYGVVYVFSGEEGWVKNDIEGSVFLCGLLPTIELAHRYAVMILNRRGLQNFDIEVPSIDNVEITDEYIILKPEGKEDPPVFGLWIYAEPPPSSTAHHRVTLGQMINECAEKVAKAKKSARQDEANENQNEVEKGVSMGRQLSLREVFGQQRQQDDAWSVRSHSLQKPPQFSMAADTEFFRAPSRHTKPSPSPVSSKPKEQRDTLMELFRKAGDSYRGGG